MSLVAIDPAQCIGCGQCAMSCPAVVLVQSERGKPPTYREEARCIRCGHCVSVCPKAALTHQELGRDGFADVVTDWNADQVEHLLRAKRSVRHYVDKPVSREVLERLLAVAAQAPTDGNSQDRGFLVLTDRAAINAFEDHVMAGFRAWVEGELAGGASPARPDLRKAQGFLGAQAAGWHPIFRQAPCVLCGYAQARNQFGAYNVIVALDYLMVQAAALGLGSCIIGAATHDPAALSEYLKLPAGMQLQAVVTLGYPKLKYRRTVVRRPPEVIWK